MTIQVVCDQCQKEYNVPDKNAGLRLKCRECGSLLLIPMPVPSPAQRPVKPPYLSRRTLLVGSLGIVLAVSGLVAMLWMSGSPPKNWELETPIIGTKPESPEAPTTIPGQSTVTDSTQVRKKPRRKVAALDPESPLKQLGTAYQQGEIQQAQYIAQLKTLGPSCPEIRLSQDRSQPVWSTIPVNAAGERFCLLRFRSPAKVPADLFVTVASNECRLEGSAILPAEGDRMLPPSSATTDGVQFVEKELPQRNVVSSLVLLNGQIQPGQDYLLWFALATIQAAELQIAATLIPSHPNHQQLRTHDDVLSFMGLDQLKPPFEPDSQGRRRAQRYCYQQFLKFVGHMEEEDFQIPDDFRLALQSISSAIPLMTVTSEEEPVQWQRFIANSIPETLDAFRIKSNLKSTAYLSMILVGKDEPRAWSLLPLEEREQPSPDYELVANVRIKGVDLPDENVGALRHFSQVAIEPGREYVLWWENWSDTPEPIQVMARLTKKPADSPYPFATEIADLAGVELDQEWMKTQIDAARRRAVSLYQNNHRPSDIQRIVRSISDSLPSLPVASGEQPLVLNRFFLDESNQHSVFLKFKSPYEAPADFRYVLVTNAPQPWVNFARFAGEIHEAGFSQLNLRLKNCPLPEKNVAFFQSRENGPILPDREYYFGFVSKTKTPSELVIALRLLPAGTGLPPNSLRSIGRSVGVEFPIAEAPSGSYVLGEHDVSVTGVRFTGDGKNLISTDFNGGLKTWSLADRKPSKPASRLVTNISLMLETVPPDPPLLVVQNAETTSLYDPLKGEAVLSFSSPPLTARAGCLSPGGDYAAIAYSDQGKDAGALVLCDLRSRKKIAEKEIRPFHVFDSVFFDQVTLLTVGSDLDKELNAYGGHLTLWKIPDLTQTTLLHQPMAPLVRFDIDRKRKQVVMGSTTGLLKLFDLGTRKELANLAQDQPIDELRLTPDGQLVAIGCRDGTICWWDWERNRIWTVFEGHSKPIGQLDFSPDGRWLASGSSDATVRMWEIAAMAKPELDPATPEITDSLGIELVPVPPGTFPQGARRGDEMAWPKERPQHEVRISKPFYLGKYEVTRGQFRQFAEAVDDRTTKWQEVGFRQTDEHPVVNVSWSDATAFCAWLSQREGTRYRLPTEAEWEYACRAGGQSLWYSGDDQRCLMYSANIEDQSHRNADKTSEWPNPWDDGFPFTAPVGRFVPNAFGLYDMHGNVGEWCNDWFNFYGSSPGYEKSTEPLIDPKGPNAGIDRIWRGGSFHGSLSTLRSSARGGDRPETRRNDVGFRVVREFR